MGDANRTETGLAAGDPVTVTVNDTTRNVNIPGDLASALRDNAGASRHQVWLDVNAIRMQVAVD